MFVHHRELTLCHWLQLTLLIVLGLFQTLTEAELD